MGVVTVRVFCVLTGSLTSTLYVREMAPPFNVVMRATGEYTTMCMVGKSPDTLQTLPQGPSRLKLEGWYAFLSYGFPGEMEFSPTSSQYPAQSRVAARAGFGDEWEKTMRNAFSPMLRCVTKMLPIIIRRCIYWCKSGDMEVQSISKHKRSPMQVLTSANVS